MKNLENLLRNPMEPIWRNLIFRIRNNDPPYNTYIRDDVLYVKTGKTFIDLKSCSIQDFIGFFNTLGLTIEYNKSEYWKDLRKKNLREKIIHNFAYKMKELHELTEEKTQQLVSQIHLDITLKKITPDDIIFDENNIDSINGLEFTEGSYLIHTDDL